MAGVRMSRGLPEIREDKTKNFFTSGKRSQKFCLNSLGSAKIWRVFVETFFMSNETAEPNLQ